MKKHIDSTPSEAQLVEQKLLTTSQLDTAKTLAAERGFSVMETIVELGYATSEDILRAFGSHAVIQRPKVIPTAMLVEFRDGDEKPYWVAHNPKSGRYLLLTEQQKFIWDRLDGRHSVVDIALAYIKAFRYLGIQVTTNFVARLGQTGFLEGVIPQADPAPVLPWWKVILKAILWKKFPLKHVDESATRLYQLAGKFFWHPAARVAALIAMTGGIILFSWRIAHRPALLVSAEAINPWIFGSLSVLVYLLCLALHEFGHALSCKHYGMTIPDGGMALYLGLPCFYVSTVNSWLSPVKVRIAISFAGSYINLILAGMFAALGLIPGNTGDFFAFMAFLNYLTVLVNLNPLGRFDGYYIAMDLMGVPGLRARSGRKVKEALGALASGKWGTIPRTSKLVLLYMVIGVAYTVGLFTLVVALNWW